ncbi:efflux RND transporter periplasmic adaptor subunit [Alistipes sp.]|uniref:efflux RND transporter periplasmic adaptor subunit n=1 Tax=Alistipes sp. TaxID=1872444 RepID=UPI0025B8125C|nr:efflux RND transporter periplasmic adaptor subunit [Alistipes sp.]MCI7139679.1 efflux RND transporter periplasmic adaptor subunit [Alistipes sp.]
MNARILILPLVWLTASCSDSSPKSKCVPLCVETACATTVEVSACREFPFIAKPLRTSILSFRVSGPVDRFEVYAGNRYRAGELIAGIDPRDFRLRYEQTDAAWRQARADYDRVAALYEKDNLPVSSYEVARATCIAAETARDAALNALNDTQLRAPFDGYVGEVFIERYQDVKASQPVVTLADISSLRIEIYVTQEIAMRARDLDEVAIEFDHLPGEIFRAQVVECARSTTPNNLSYLLTALLPNPEGAFPAGVSGRVQFDLPGESRPAVAIPRKALCHTPASADHVWTVDPVSGRVAQRQISAGELLPGDRIAVNAGLTSGETVAVSGLRFLNDGQIVECRNTDKVRTIELQRP